jgi:N-formylglutamate amidohydrolase
MFFQLFDKILHATIKKMKDLHKDTIPGIYRVERAAKPLPLVFDSPHSGTTYPPDFDFACDFAALEKAEDKFVDELFASAPAHGGNFLCAEFPRSYIDVNRCEKDIDINLLDDLWEEWEEEVRPTARSHAGIGLIRRLVRPGLPLYDRPLKASEIRHRIEHYYRPYHRTLERLMDEAHYNFGHVFHINCHSMPSHEPQTSRPNPLRGADFVLGDRDGTTCDIHLTQAVRDYLRGLGYHVAINDPYKGVELVRRYASPATGRHSIQIEVARSLYLNEKNYRKSKNYNVLKYDIDKLIQFCANYVSEQSLPMAAD